jgi:hypothetical protein
MILPEQERQQVQVQAGGSRKRRTLKKKSMKTMKKKSMKTMKKKSMKRKAMKRKMKRNANE